VPVLLRRLYRSGSLKTPRYAALAQEHPEDEGNPLEHAAETASSRKVASLNTQAIVPLSLTDTARLSLEFCILWFLANYFVAACLKHTTVASSTILTSTSSIFTLLLGCAVGVEIFTLRKLLGVLASLLGVVLISSVDLFGDNDDGRGLFPHKSARQVALGDAMALISAILYGIYAVLMKKRIGDERRISMPVFFGLVGLFNVILLWPGFLILHFTGVETFELPPSSRVTAIILVSCFSFLVVVCFFCLLNISKNFTQINSCSSLLSDIAWAYAVLLTSPIVVTVGLSTTIPLSLIGQLIINNQTSPAIYWLGACVVVLSFLFVNHEEAADEENLGALQERAGASSVEEGA
jgi:solute carrier family 35 protein F5